MPRRDVRGMLYWRWWLCWDAGDCRWTLTLMEWIDIHSWIWIEFKWNKLPFVILEFFWDFGRSLVQDPGWYYENVCTYTRTYRHTYFCEAFSRFFKIESAELERNRKHLNNNPWNPLNWITTQTAWLWWLLIDDTSIALSSNVSLIVMSSEAGLTTFLLWDADSSTCNRSTMLFER